MALDQKDSAANKTAHLARIHALWTLEGLGAMDKNTLFGAFRDPEAQVRKAAVWISEMYIKKGDEEVISRLTSLKDDPSPDVRIQLSLSLRGHEKQKVRSILTNLLAANPGNQLMQFSYKMFIEKKETLEAEKKRTANLGPEERKLVTKGSNIFKTLCATCHGPDGKGITIGGKEMPAPPLVGSPRVKGDKILLTQLLLNGLKGPVDGKNYKDMMPAMGGNDDEWIASVLSYIRNSGELGNKASVVTTDEVKKIRATTPKIPEGMTLQMLEIFKLGRAEKTNWDKSGRSGRGSK